MYVCGILEFDDDTMILNTSLNKGQLDALLSEVPALQTMGKLARDSLIMYLKKLRLGGSNEIIESSFGVKRKQVAARIATVRNILTILMQKSFQNTYRKLEAVTS